MSRVIKVEPADDGNCDRPLIDCGKGRFKYVLSCGHVLNWEDRRRWIGGVLTHPKTIKCPKASCQSRAVAAARQEGGKV